MNVTTTKKFKKAYDRLPLNLQKKTKKAIDNLRENLFYPGLNAKKMKGSNRWEARISKSYRITFYKIEDTLILRTIGPHDEGLGKK